MTSKQVDLILVDDDKFFSDVVVDAFEIRNKVVEQYFSASEILENVVQYPLGTKICLDYNLGGNMSGLDLAQTLYELGYCRLYLLSGMDFFEEDIPAYLQVILKTDIDKLYSLLDD